MSYVAPLLSEHVQRLLNGGHLFWGEIPSWLLMQACCLLGKHQTSTDGMICADNCTLVLRSIKSVQKMLQLPFV